MHAPYLTAVSPVFACLAQWTRSALSHSRAFLRHLRAMRRPTSLGLHPGLRRLTPRRMPRCIGSPCRSPQPTRAKPQRRRSRTLPTWHTDLSNSRRRPSSRSLRRSPAELCRPGPRECAVRARRTSAQRQRSGQGRQPFAFRRSELMPAFEFLYRFGKPRLA